MIISITNQKGGVGKTTTAVNVSACLAQLGYKTLLIDMDSQANATRNLIDKESTNTAIELINGINSVICTKYANLDLVPASIKLAKFNGENMQLSKAISKLDYDYIIIDCPPALGSLTINAMCASNYIIIPLEASKFALQGTKTLLDTISIIQKNIAPKLKIMGIVLTKLNGRTKISKDIRKSVQESYLNTFKTVIHESVKIQEAQYHNKTIIDYARYSTPAIEYLSLAKEIISYGI